MSIWVSCPYCGKNIAVMVNKTSGFTRMRKHYKTGRRVPVISSMGINWAMLPVKKELCPGSRMIIQDKEIHENKRD